jgi:hypothetical protein
MAIFSPVIKSILTDLQLGSSHWTWYAEFHEDEGLIFVLAIKDGSVNNGFCQQMIMNCRKRRMRNNS